MLHVFGRVNYFFDGVTKASARTGQRGETVPLFTTGARPSETTQTQIAQIMPRLEGYGPTIGLEWRLQSVQITQTRVWACSSAKFTIVTPFVPGQLLPMPPVHPEMPLSIDLGYSETPFPPADLPILADDEEGEAWRPRRRFMGYVDTIQIKTTAKRIVCTVSCRDKLRFLVDNRMVGMFNSQALFDPEQGGQSDDFFKEKDRLSFKIGDPTPTDVGGETRDFRLRQEIVRTLIEMGGNGGITAEDMSRAQLSDGRWDFENIAGFIGGQADPASLLVRAPMTRDEAEGDKDDATLDPLVNTFVVMNKAPIEPLKRLSVLEGELPKELYADHNGKVHWQRRLTTNYEAPWEYYLLQKPEDTTGLNREPHPVIAGTGVFSTIGTVNQIILCNPQYQSGTNSSMVITASGQLDPIQTYGFDMRPRNRFIFDDTLGAAGIAEGQFDDLVSPVLDALFLIWGKDIRGGEIEIFGNPSLYVGDSVRVHNLPFFQYDEPASKRAITRADAVVDTLLAEGPTKGYRARVLLTRPVETAADDLKKSVRDFSRFGLKVPRGTLTSNEGLN